MSSSLPLTARERWASPPIGVYIVFLPPFVLDVCSLVEFGVNLVKVNLVKIRGCFRRVVMKEMKNKTGRETCWNGHHRGDEDQPPTKFTYIFEYKLTNKKVWTGF